MIRACADARRPGQPGTWITRDMEIAYCRLHQLGYAHSAEAWDGERLVAGVYGVALGGVFFGESMFAETDDASKIAFVWLVRQLEAWGFELVDCQMRTAHLARFGAEPWSRARYLKTPLAATSREGRAARALALRCGILSTGAGEQGRNGVSRVWTRATVCPPASDGHDATSAPTWTREPSQRVN